jgi:nitroreductase
MAMPEGGDRPAMPGGGAGGAKASLGDSPLAIIVYMNPGSKSPAPEYDCGLATQNMVIAASALGYGVKIVSSPTMNLNGEKHDEICEKLGVDTGLKAVAVLLIGRPAEETDAVSSASVRDELNAKSVIIH